MSDEMKVTLPAWTHAFPAESGTYLIADEYGRVSLLHVLRVAKDGLAECYGGQRIFYCSDWFCGPLRRVDLFSGEVLASIEKAWSDLPAKRLVEAEERVRRNPRSRNAKAELAAAKAAVGAKEAHRG